MRKHPHPLEKPLAELVAILAIAALAVGTGYCIWLYWRVLGTRHPREVLGDSMPMFWGLAALWGAAGTVVCFLVVGSVTLRFLYRAYRWIIWARTTPTRDEAERDEEFAEP